MFTSSRITSIRGYVSAVTPTATVPNGVVLVTEAKLKSDPTCHWAYSNVAVCPVSVASPAGFQ